MPTYPCFDSKAVLSIPSAAPSRAGEHSQRKRDHSSDKKKIILKEEKMKDSPIHIPLVTHVKECSHEVQASLDFIAKQN